MKKPEFAVFQKAVVTLMMRESTEIASGVLDARFISLLNEAGVAPALTKRIIGAWLHMTDLDPATRASTTMDEKRLVLKGFERVLVSRYGKKWWEKANVV